MTTKDDEDDVVDGGSKSFFTIILSSSSSIDDDTGGIITYAFVPEGTRKASNNKRRGKVNVMLDGYIWLVESFDC